MEVKEQLVEIIQDTKFGGIPKYQTCAVLQIHVRRVERWLARHKQTGSMSDFKPGPKHSWHAIMPYEREAVLSYVGQLPVIVIDRGTF